ncbi:MAG: carbohydrate ABC transporter permease [Rhodospirillales bacterium]|nr:carbohydrate ABC transporter permease [Rhodospirillales bacterium]MDE0378075.1 carbohydrate ABC transporter permease [Rhodospirillales bacterium]
MSFVRRLRGRWRSASGYQRLGIVVIGAAILVLIWSTLPFLLMFWVSLMTEGEMVTGVVGNIEKPTLEHYLRILGHADEEAIFGGQTKQIGRGFLNSMIVSLPAAFMATVIATLAGYAFGRFTFPGQMGLLFALLFTRVLPPIAVLIPYYSFFQAVGLIGSPVGLFLTYLTGITPLLAWILMGYFATLPIEVERAARVDGCGRLQVLWYIIVPMAMPGISAAFIIAFLFCWNELLFGIILVGGTGGQTLSPTLLAIGPLTAAGASPMVLFAAASTLSIAPPLVLALIFQRFITRLNIVDPITTRDI